MKIQRFEDFISLVNTAHKSLQKIKTYEVKEFGLRGSHVMCVFYLGQNAGGLTAGEICEKCKEDKAAVSRTLACLIEKEYVVLMNDANRKYKLKYVLTPKGKKAYEEICNHITNRVNEFGEDLTDEERAVFYRAFGKIVDNFENFCGEFTAVNEKAERIPCKKIKM